VKSNLTFCRRKLRNAAVPGPVALAFALASALFLAAACPGIAQDVLEPQALRLQVTNAYLGVLANGNFEKDTVIGQSNETASYNQLFLGPVIGLDAYGSIYHPNLLNFTLDGEIAPGYTFSNTHSSTYLSTAGTGFTLLGNYDVKFNFLENKPYGASAFLSQSYTDQDLDFFNQEQISTLFYGVNLGYQTGPVPFTIGITRMQQYTTGGPYEVTTDETGLTFGANNTRASGQSTLSYAYTDYQLTELGTEGSGPAQSIGLDDMETFGSEKQAQWTTNAGYGTQSVAGNPSNNLDASTHLSIQHTPALSSAYDLNYDREDADTPDGSAKSNNFYGDISLSHQLYQSLTSTLLLQGLDYSSTDNVGGGNNGQDNSGTQTIQYGGGVTEQYIKRLGPTTRLSLGGSLFYEHTIQNETGSTIIQTNEAHTFSANSDSFFLNLPNVDQTTIIVTNNKGALPAYQEGIDYTVSQNGSLTMIRRTATSSIPENVKVLVTYTADTAPTGQYDTMTSAVSLRVDFWNGLLGVYGRWNSVQNFGVHVTGVPEDSLGNNGTTVVGGLQQLSDFAIGVDATWKWLRGGMEYETYDSSYGSYHNARLYESLAFNPDKLSALNFDFNESESFYTDSSLNQQDLSAISHYRRSFADNLGFDLEAGVDLIRGGSLVDQTLIAIRPGFDFAIGQLTVKVSYSFQYANYLNSTKTVQQMFFISMQRTF